MAPPLRGVMGDLLEEVDASNGTDLSEAGGKAGGACEAKGGPGAGSEAGGGHSIGAVDTRLDARFAPVDTRLKVATGTADGVSKTSVQASVQSDQGGQ